MYIIYDGQSCVASVIMVSTQLYSDFILYTCLMSRDGCYNGSILSGINIGGGGGGGG